MRSAPPSRRIPAGTLSLAVAVACVGCGSEDARQAVPPSEPDTRLAARAAPVRAARCGVGEHELRLADGRRALLRVTAAGSTARRGLLLALHDAGSGGAPGGLWAFRGAWNVPGLVLVAPAASGSAWTPERRDVAFVDRALERAFARCPIDPRRVAVGGFSSGAGMRCGSGSGTATSSRR